MYFSPYVGMQPRGGGGQTGLVYNLLLQFFTLHSPKIQVFEAFFLIP